jgi:hypothetical protein
MNQRKDAVAVEKVAEKCFAVGYGVGNEHGSS